MSQPLLRWPSPLCDVTPIPCDVAAHSVMSHSPFLTSQLLCGSVTQAQRCYQNFSETKPPQHQHSTKQQHSLLGQMHEGRAPPKVVCAEFRNVPVCRLCFTDTFPDCPTRNTHTIITAPKSLHISPTPLHIRSSALGVSLGVPGGR